MARRAGDVLAELVLRPQVPMGAFHALGYVCTLGASEGLRSVGVEYAALGWPQDVVDERTYRPLLQIRMRAGYDKGMYAACEVLGAQQVGLLRTFDDATLAAALEQGVRARVEFWEAQIVAGAGAAGPLAPILADYFDAVALMGQRVEVVYPNGNLMTRGELAGVDVWGRATVRTDAGEELELAPEQASLRKA